MEVNQSVLVASKHADALMIFDYTSAPTFNNTLISNLLYLPNLSKKHISQGESYLLSHAWRDIIVLSDV